jgi:hypothetical protein
MAKKTAGLPAEEPNRKSKTDRVGGVPSRNVKTSKVDGTVDVFGPLAPQGNKRTSKDVSVSAPPAKGSRPDALGYEDSTRTNAPDPQSRAFVKHVPGVDAVRTGDNIDQLAQGDVPDDL